jgi:hypothetical protein
MKINITEEIDKRTHLGWFIIEMLCAHEKASGKSIDKIVSPPTDKSDAYAEVVFTINGEEIDIRHHIQRVDSQFDRCVREEAVKMVTSVLGADYMTRLDNLRQTFESFEYMIREKFGLPPAP